MQPVGYGRVIRRLRESRGWKQPTLAKQANVSIDTVVRAEQGDNLGIFLIQQIAIALDVDVVTLFGGTPLPKAPRLAGWDSLTTAQRAYLEKLVAMWHDEESSRGPGEAG